MGDRLPVFAANWKMHTTVLEGIALAQSLRSLIDGDQRAKVVLCPPFTHLVPIADCLSGSTLRLGAQDVYWESKGAFTGEISPLMLQGLVDFVIIGHSERRAHFGETDADVNRKVGAALETDLMPILCVGETGEQRESGQTEAVLRHQIQQGLSGIDLDRELVIAYEPVWAIGTGVSAHGEQAQEAVAFIRTQVRALNASASDRIPILYGGSVTATNVAEFAAQPDIDGALVGGASLVADGFAALVSAGIASTVAKSTTRI
jgi:triosephosphate isomerase (TIM)